MEHKGSQTYLCLRCQNFETLEDQLHSIQNDLSDLTSLVRGGNSVRSSSLAAEEWASENLTAVDSGTVVHTNCHIVRNASQSIDRYHGPCSLYALCKEFHDDPIFGIPENSTSTHPAVPEHAMLQEMLYEAGNEPHLDIPSQPIGICLPPRQFLNLVIGPFFKNTDYATDVFVRSTFQPQIDRIYSQPIGPSDEGWAVCFNVIVLLGIKREPTTQGNSHFIQSLLQTMRMAINNPRVFLTPRLVNVQALALLSYVAEQYRCESGALSSLESHSESPEAMARLELAKLQDEVYQIFYGHNTASLKFPRSQALGQLQQKLEQWASTYNIMQTPFTSTESFALMLSFLATRICLFKGYNSTKSIHIFKDAKACCLVFLQATAAKKDRHLSEALNETLGHQKNREKSSTKKAKRNSQAEGALAEHDENGISMLPRLAITFPLVAAFIIGKTIIQQPMTDADDTPSRPEEEISLLEALRDQFASVADRAHVDNLALNFSKVLGLSSSSLHGSVPLESPTGGSPWFANAGHGIGMNHNPVLVAWPSQSKRQPEEAEIPIKRPRIACHDDFLDIGAGYADHGSRPDDDVLFTFDFLNTGNDISAFGMDE
ncbi:gal4like transcriptional activator [Fusarium sporotrichioides]|uniref:Gal4like transcriptional activator n=1 Tax=Fusarium sporotrichioides TaxID=5514 RepID=A0A395SUZ4_FUSSP|nr:gal4like transcriptional activator [Fusarium sporotrichioides]